MGVAEVMRSSLDSMLEESGFEPLAPLQNGQANVGEVAGREKVGRQVTASRTKPIIRPCHKNLCIFL
jgi:hypothetical protein